MRWRLYRRVVVVEPLPMLIRHHSLCMCSHGWRFEYGCAVLVLNQESGPAGLWYVWSRTFWVLGLLPHLKWPLKLDFLVRNSRTLTAPGAELNTGASVANSQWKCVCCLVWQLIEHFHPAWLYMQVQANIASHSSELIRLAFLTSKRNVVTSNMNSFLIGTFVANKRHPTAITHSYEKTMRWFCSICLWILNV